MRMWFERADNPDNIEYIFALNKDDKTIPAFQTAIFKPWAYLDSDEKKKRQIFQYGDFPGSAPAWDAAAKASTGLVLIQAQDDVEPPVGGWDTMLLEWLEGANVNPNHWRTVPTVVAVRDGYRRDRLLCTAICNRVRYNQVGHFLFPEYLSVFSDDDFSYSAYRDERDGKCMVVRTDLEFRHEHAYHNSSVPMDATYARENSSIAYGLGADLFFKRNPEAHKDGLRNW